MRIREAALTSILGGLAGCALGQNPPRTPNFGTVTTVYQRIPGSDFIAATTQSVGSCGSGGGAPTVGSTTWDPSNGSFTYLLRPEVVGGCNNFTTSPQLPGGALLTYVEMDSCESNPSGQHVELDVYACDRLGVCSPTPLATLSSSANSLQCDAVSAPLSYTVDNRLNQLLLNVHIDLNPGTPTNGLAGVVLGYTLQVSPAPATATFNDVPTSHPFFQFVEALAASGITAGCGGGNYCPDNPLTRGQMAVFLAKALGLNWSQ
jgi:S-layer family protein